MLTTNQVAERIGVAYPTVMLWLKKGRIPDAVKEPSPRGDYWLIPETSIAGLSKGKPGPKKADASPDVAEVTPAKKARKAKK